MGNGQRKGRGPLTRNQKRALKMEKRRKRRRKRNTSQMRITLPK